MLPSTLVDFETLKQSVAPSASLIFTTGHYANHISLQASGLLCHRKVAAAVHMWQCWQIDMY